MQIMNPAKNIDFQLTQRLLTTLFSRLYISKTHTYNKEPCWEWTGKKNNEGYGCVSDYSTGKRLVFPVHRIAYHFFASPLSVFSRCDHLCKNRICFNPLHLEAVTEKENILRGDGICAQYARRDHCTQGHVFTMENTRLSRDKKGRLSRVCKTCKQERLAAFFRKIAALPSTHPQRLRYESYVPGAVRRGERELTEMLLPDNEPQVN